MHFFFSLNYFFFYFGYQDTAGRGLGGMHRGALGAVAPPGGRYLPGSATPAEALHLAATATEAAAAAAVGRRLELKRRPRRTAEVTEDGAALGDGRTGGAVG